MTFKKGHLTVNVTIKYSTFSAASSVHREKRGGHGDVWSRVSLEFSSWKYSLVMSPNGNPIAVIYHPLLTVDRHCCATYLFAGIGL